jgi:UDP:flavonoid glycosyltransferase YjiC (YdhE family)
MDWPAGHELGGFWLPERAAEPAGEEGKRILELLAEEGPSDNVVYVGFGSLEHLYGRALDVVPRLLLELGCRAVIQTRRGVAAPRSGLLYVSGPLSHDWLFRRVRAAVHHGGAGTFARACRAGIPSLPIAAAADSAFWARRGRELGVSPPEVDVFSGEGELRRALAALVGSQALRAAALGLGRALRAEEGPSRGAELIDRILAVAGGSSSGTRGRRQPPKARRNRSA